MKAPFKDGPSSETCRRMVDLPVIPAPEEEVELGAREARILLEYWQARCGAIVTVCAADGRFHRARVTALSAEGARLVVFTALPFAPESPLFLEVFQALPQRERFELVLEKLVELGVTRIAPFVSAHSITLEERDARQRKSHRWPDVVLRAARQCRRALVPELVPVLSREEALARMNLNPAFDIVLCETEKSLRLSTVLEAPAPSRVRLWVGPEGGFSPEEVAVFKTSGACCVSLGGRILRTETAAIAAAAVIQHRWGDFG